MNSTILAHRKSIRQLYKAASLQDICDNAVAFVNTELGDKDFSEYQRQVFQQIFPGFQYEYCVTSTITTDVNMGPTSVSSVCLDLPETVLESYMMNAQYDEMSPVVYLNPGRAISHTQFYAHGTYTDHPFFVNHCIPFNIHNVYSIGFLHPGHHSTFIAFDYLGDKNNQSWTHFDFTRLELASFPFVLAWLFRNGLIDQTELQKRYLALADMTESQLANLRKFINSPNESYAEQAKSLGIKEATLKESLYKTRDLVSPRFGETSSKAAAKSRALLRPLEARYAFLRMLGDQTLPIRGLKAKG